MTTFYVIMQKRQDGKVYTDLHKTNQIIYLNYEYASCDLNKKDHFKKYYHIVKMIATFDEGKE